MELVGESRAHHEILCTLDRVATTDVEVLFTGPSGVGKELYARYLHDRSPRADESFVAVNCGTLNADLLENELFGHASGAYTSARDDRDGLASSAHQGTLFFDEVDTLPAASQVKLLRFVQQKEFRRVGEQRLQRVDVRFISASNADLRQAVASGAFREDLFFRLRVVPIAIPPLRERPEDVPPLVERFTDLYAKQYRLPPIKLAESAWRWMAEYAWPGNVRELENCIRYLTCIQLSRPAEAGDLPLVGPAPRAACTLAEAKREAIAEVEQNRITSALRRTNGNIAAAAREEGKARRAFFELMRKYGIRAERFR